MYEDVLLRYSELLDGPFRWLTDAMSWSVVTGGGDVRSVIRRLGGEPHRIGSQRPVDFEYEHARAQSRWYLDEAGGAVVLLEVNNFQASRPEVLRRLSDQSDEAYSAYWNIEMDNAFSYAAAGELVTTFNGGYPVRRFGSRPDALEGERELLWAADGSWRAAMLALAEVRTGVRLESSWFEVPHPTVLVPWMPDDPPVPTLEGDIVELLSRRGNVRRHAALAWLTETLADRFALNAPAMARAIEARRTGTQVDKTTQSQVRESTRQIVQQSFARAETVPQHLDPDWRRGQAAMAAVMVLDFFDPSILVLHAQNALADDWPSVAAELRNRL